MRILLVNKFLYPKGGAEIVCLDLERRLRAAGHEVRLFGMADPRNPAAPDADCFPDNVDYHADRSLLRKVAEAGRTISSSQSRSGLTRLLDRWRPDIVHMHNIYHQLTPSILAPPRERGIPVILTLHDYKLICPVYTLLREGRPCEQCLGKLPWPLLKHRCKSGSLAESAVLFAEAAWHRWTRSYERGVTRFTSPSRFLRDKVIAGGLDAGRIVYLPNALPLDDATLARPYAPPPEREVPELLWVGRMSREKGLVTLLKALARCERPLRLILVGDGPQDEELRALAAELELGDRLEFLGRKPRQEVMELLLRTDGSIMPSEWYENAPLSLLESLALGRAPLASDIGGIPEMLAEGETAWLFPPGDAAALATALAAWADSAQERLARGRRAFDAARARFGPQTVLDQTLELYDSLKLVSH